MANDRDVEIVITASSDEVIEAARQINGALGNVEKEARGLSSLNPFKGLTLSFTEFNQALELGRKGIDAFSSAIDFAQETDRVFQLNSAFRDFQETAGRDGVTALQELRTATANTVSDTELLASANKALAAGIPAAELSELAEVSRRLGQAVGQDAAQSFNDLSVGIARNSTEVLDNLGLLVRVGDANQVYAEKIGKTVDQLTAQEQKQAFLNATLDAAREKVTQLGEAQETSGTAAQRLTATFDNLVAQLQLAVAENEDVAEAFNAVQKALSEVDTDTIAKGVANLTALLPPLIGFLTDIVGVASEVAAVLNGDFNNALGRGIQEIERWIDTARRATDFTGSYAASQALAAKQQEILNDILGKFDSVAEDANTQKSKLTERAQDFIKATQVETEEVGLSQAQIQELIKENDRLLASKKQVQTSFTETAKNASQATDEIKKTTSAVEDFFGEGFGQLQEGAFEALGADLRGVLESSITSAISGSFGREDVANTIEGAAGALGAAFGIPFADQVAGPFADAISQIGKDSASTVKGILSTGLADFFLPGASTLAASGVLDGVIGSVFGDSAGTTARKQIDRFFADALDANRLKLVIDGQLQQVSDLQFSGLQTGGIFDTLEADTQEAFTNIGTLIETTFGVAQDLGVNTGTVLANNLGGSLNNVQILLKQIGVSAEDLRGPLEESFLAGELSATAARDALASIEDLAQSGIPGAIGATQDAFGNLIASAGTGAAAVDALGDVAAEAGEKGITTLGELEQDLKGSGRFAAEEVDKFIGVLAQQFGDTFFELEEVSTSAAIQAAAALEDVGFAFSPISDELGSIKDAIDAIPRVRDVTVNVRANVSSEDRELIRSVGGGNAEFAP